MNSMLYKGTPQEYTKYLEEQNVNIKDEMELLDKLNKIIAIVLGEI